MTGIGKIISGKKKQISASAQAGSRAPWITGQLQTARLQQTMGDVYSSLALGGSLASSYMTAMEPYEQIQAGGKEVGIDVPDLSIKDRIGMMFGKGDDMLIKNYEAEGSDSYQYREDDPLSVKQTHQYSGATLMDIGKRSQAGTLQSYLGDESIGQKFGKDISEQKWWDAKMGQMDSHQPSEFSDNPWEGMSTRDRNLVNSVGYEQYMEGQKAELSRRFNKTTPEDQPDMVSNHPDLAGTGGSAEYRALNPDDTTFYGNPQNKDQYAPWEKPPPMPREPVYTNMHEADYQGEPTNIGGAADTADLTDYASYDTGYRTSNLHASGYAGLGVDPNAGGDAAIKGSGAGGDTGYNQPTDMSGDTLWGRANKRFEHTPSPGYAGATERQRASEPGYGGDPLAGYEERAGMSAKPSWLGSYQMYDASGDTTTRW